VKTKVNAITNDIQDKMMFSPGFAGYHVSDEQFGLNNPTEYFRDDEYEFSTDDAIEIIDYSIKRIRGVGRK